MITTFICEDCGSTLNTQTEELNKCSEIYCPICGTEMILFDNIHEAEEVEEKTPLFEHLTKNNPVEEKLVGRKARCHCGEIQDSHQDLPFFVYRGIGSEEFGRSCVCGYVELAHNQSDKRLQVACNDFRPDPNQKDRFYCGCNGWD